MSIKNLSNPSFKELNEVNYLKSLINKPIKIYNKNGELIFENVVLISYDNNNLFVKHEYANKTEIIMIRKDMIGFVKSV